MTFGGFTGRENHYISCVSIQKDKTTQTSPILEHIWLFPDSSDLRNIYPADLCRNWDNTYMTPLVCGSQVGPTRDGIEDSPLRRRVLSEQISW